MASFLSVHFWKNAVEIVYIDSGKCIGTTGVSELERANKLQYHLRTPLRI